jgi:hypothetical protein
MIVVVIDPRSPPVNQPPADRIICTIRILRAPRNPSKKYRGGGGDSSPPVLQFESMPSQD